MKSAALALFGLLALSIIATVHQAYALDPITFTTKTSVTSANTLFQQVYENGTSSAIFLDAAGNGTFYKREYNVSSGTLTTDSDTVSGSGNTLNSAAYTSPVDISRYSLDLDGAGDYVTIPYVNLGGDITYSMRFYSDVALGADINIFSFMNTLLRIEGGGVKWYPDIDLSSVNIATPAINDNTWYHIAVVQSGTTYTVYINGASIGTGTTNPIDTTNTSNQIGAFGGTNNFDGPTDDVAIYNDDLSPAQIVQLATGSEITTNLQEFYTFNAGP